MAHLLATIGVQTYPGTTSYPTPPLRIDVEGLVDVVEANHRTSRKHREPTRAVVSGRLPNLTSHILAWLGFDARRRQPVGKSHSQQPFSWRLSIPTRTVSSRKRHFAHSAC
jgi:hypothetical protein